MASERLFRVADPNFCGRCGSVLPPPTMAGSNVTCRKCHNKIEVSDFDGLTTTRTIVFNKSSTSTDSAQYQTAGPSLDRVCSSCGNPTMTYKTQQTRSADEGQTVFFSCPKCGNQEIEYS
ncbi:DNA-directed RNA polymerase I subunit RPA12-like isoform X2 [Watersipora subatra]